MHQSGIYPNYNTDQDLIWDDVDNSQTEEDPSEHPYQEAFDQDSKTNSVRSHIYASVEHHPADSGVQTPSPSIKKRPSPSHSYKRSPVSLRGEEPRRRYIVALHFLSFIDVY